MQIEFFGQTDIGKVRTENQDYFLISEEKSCFILCDGMGGAACGDFASKVSSEIVKYVVEKEISSLHKNLISYCFKDTKEQINPPFEIQEDVLLGIFLANRILYKLGQDYPLLSGMGTTIVCLIIDKKYNIAHIFHAGDSRLYRFRNGILEQLTKDHSKIEELLTQGKITQQQIKTAEFKSMVVRVLGPKENLIVDYRIETIYPGDIFLLVSDGITDALSDYILQKKIQENLLFPKKLCNILIEQANEQGGKDNSTVIVVKINSLEGKVLPPKELNRFIGKIYEAKIKDEKISEFNSFVNSQFKELKIRVPEKAKEKGIYQNPLVLSFIFLLFISLFVGVASYYRSKQLEFKQEIEKKLISGINLEIRIPLKEELIKYKTIKDEIEKEMLVEQWRLRKEEFTQHAKNVRFKIYDIEEKEIFKGSYKEEPIEIPMKEGKYKLVVENHETIPMNFLLDGRGYFEVIRAKEFKNLTVVIIPQ